MEAKQSELLDGRDRLKLAKIKTMAWEEALGMCTSCTAMELLRFGKADRAVQHERFYAAILEETNVCLPFEDRFTCMLGTI
ncbi:hypothetical protein Peur_015771 [Populus x canadensis]